MKIFGIGLSRTGTTSLTSFLNSIGFNIIHYPNNKKQLFSKDNDGATDIPVITYYKELDKTYPNSKFIYTIRNKEDWINSMSRYLPRKKGRPTETHSWTLQHRLTAYGRTDFNRKDFDKRFDEYDAEIKEYFRNREQDLLILNIFENPSVQELCSFLNITHVDTSQNYPHENKLIIK